MSDFNVTRWFKDQYLTEAGEGTTKSNELAKRINDSIISIDDSMSYKDFAQAVAKVIIDEYGQHLFTPFLNHIKNEFSKEEPINEYGEYKPEEEALAKEISNKFDTGRVNVSLGKYSGGRSDSDPLKDKSFGKITFMVRSEFEDSTWGKIVDFVKSKGFEVTQDANYYDIEPGEREWFPSINFNFNQSNL